MSFPRLTAARAAAGTGAPLAGAACAVCTPIGNGGGALWKPTDPDWFGAVNTIPADVRHLVHAAGDDRDLGSRARGLFLCPGCGAAFLYELSYEFLAGGSEDEETWTRLTDADAEDWLARLPPRA